MWTTLFNRNITEMTSRSISMKKHVKSLMSQTSFEACWDVQCAAERKAGRECLHSEQMLVLKGKHLNLERSNVNLFVRNTASAIVLHAGVCDFRIVKILPGGSFENIQNIITCSFKVSGGIVGLGDKELQKRKKKSQ